MEGNGSGRQGSRRHQEWVVAGVNIVVTVTSEASNTADHKGSEPHYLAALHVRSAGCTAIDHVEHIFCRIKAVCAYILKHFKLIWRPFIMLRNKYQMS